MKSKIVCILITIIASLNIYAYDYMYGKVKIGSLYYKLDEDYKTATVTNSITKSLGEQSYRGEIIIPSTIMYEGEMYDVTEIDFRAFEYSKYLRSIIIPNSVKKIGEYAFDGCRELTTVVLPEKIRRIEDSSFEGCLKLQTINLNENLQYIGENAFAFCRAITTLNIPSGVRKIGNDAFYEVNNVVYEGNAEGSPWGAMNVNKSSNGYLIFSDKSKTVVESCAKHASGNITIPSGVTKISANAFEQCIEITSISIPSTLEYIEYGAFIGCAKLEYLTIPKSVQTIEVEAFRDCKSLTLKIPEKFRGELGTINCKSIIYY